MPETLRLKIKRRGRQVAGGSQVSCVGVLSWHPKRKVDKRSPCWAGWCSLRHRGCECHAELRGLVLRELSLERHEGSGEEKALVTFKDKEEQGLPGGDRGCQRGQMDS